MNGKSEEIKELLKLKNQSKVVNEEKYPDSIEIDTGGTGQRGKLYFNADDLEGALKRLKVFFDLAKKRDELLKAREVKQDE